MRFELLGWPEDGPVLQLDHRSFAYAGKFVRETTGKVVARTDDVVLGALSFNRDRATDCTWRVRTITVHRDHQGEGIGSRLLAAVADRLIQDGDAVLIAVNNPIAYQAAYRGGFEFTGETSGMAELVCRYPASCTSQSYGAGMARYASREDLPAEMRQFARNRSKAPQPEPVTPPMLC